MQINATQIWGEEISGLLIHFRRLAVSTHTQRRRLVQIKAVPGAAVGSADENETLHLLSRTGGDRVLRAHSTASWKVAAHFPNVD